MRTNPKRSSSLRLSTFTTRLVAASMLLWLSWHDPAQARPLCDGGEVIWKNGQHGYVGCVFSKFGKSEKSQCEGGTVLKPTRKLFAPTCWVCIEDQLVSAIKDSGQWSQFKVGFNRSSAGKGDFSCLNPLRVKDVGRVGTVLQPTHRQQRRVRAQWTRWLNRDSPSGTGDFETLRDHRREKPQEVCDSPVDVQCRVRGSGELVETGLLASGEELTCDKAVGAVCDNRRQPPGIRCRDYEVRFACQQVLRAQGGRTGAH